MTLFIVRIALLVLLWLFILFVVLVQRNDTKTVKAPKVSSQSRGAKAQTISIVEGPLAGSRMELTNYDEIIIGRASDCSFVVGDDYASARHARLLKRGSEWFVEDLDSRNGTFVDGYRIDQPEKVHTGADIKIGRSTIRLVA